MPRKKTNNADRQPTPAEIVPEVLETLDAIEAERTALKERQSAQFGRLYEELNMSKAAVQAFMKRRRLSDEQRVQFDRDFTTLCSANHEPFQPDLFDQLNAQDWAEGAADSSARH